MNNDIVEKFSSHLKNVLTRALCFVVETNMKTIRPVHLIWALGTQKGCIGAEILSKGGVTPEKLRKLVGATAASGTENPNADALMLQLNEDAKRILEKAVLCAHVYGHRYVGTEHLLSGLMQVGSPRVKSFLEEEEADVELIKEQLAIVLKSTSRFPDIADAIESDVSETASLLPDETLTPAVDTEEETEQKKTPALDYFGMELTSEETQGRIDPVIGRENEIHRVMEILCRRTKNNPLLLGEPGVGKTAIVEGLAKKIYEGRVPTPLAGKRVIALDLALVIAGTMYRGEFEGRLRQIIDEAKADPNIILFIDEVHTMVGAGSASGSMDAANMLKPALARGEIRCIGATTPDEFKKHLENDSALERRFQNVRVEEPSADRALEILRGLAPHYERYHGVRIAPAAIESAVRLSERYIQNKRLPDKALDLLDEASAAARVHSSEPGPHEQRRLLETRIEQLRTEKRQAVIEERFLDAISLKEEEQNLKTALKSTGEQKDPETHLLITERDVAGVVARTTGVPLADILMEEQARLADLENELGEHIIGQDDAVSHVASALRRAKAGISEPNRPLASLLFLGPSGVGKTELAKAIAERVFHDKKALIRLDMSEYAEGFTISKLIGAPAGYVGYRENARLTDLIRQRPYSVVLFDELEKAHRDVQNLLLQVLEEGEITDATGKKTSFRHTIVVMTSNVGLERFERGGIGFSSGAAEDKIVLNEDLMRELNERFRPELINRIDRTLVFQPLAQETIQQITNKQLAELVVRMQERGTELMIESEVAQLIAKSAKESGGARDLRRLIQKDIESQIADRLIKDPRPKRLTVGLKRGKITVTKPRKAQANGKRGR